MRKQLIPFYAGNKVL